MKIKNENLALEKSRRVDPRTSGCANFVQHCQLNSMSGRKTFWHARISQRFELIEITVSAAYCELGEQRLLDFYRKAYLPLKLENKLRCASDIKSEQTKELSALI